jgi:hypothetical protein
MKRLIILAMLVFSAASIAKAQADPCPTCMQIYQEATSRVTHASEDENRFRHSLRTAPFAARFYMSFYASVVVTNDTARKVRQITWESSLINVATQKTIATYTFVTRKKIAAHEVVTLSKKIEVPLDPSVISAEQTIPVRRGVPNVIRTEQVSKIREIEYTDGSVSVP